MVISIGFTQKPELGKWRWSEDTLQPTDDKQVHGVGSYGGDGFSKNDVIYNTIGVGTAYLIDRLWESKINENKSTYIEIYPRSIRFGIYFN